MSSTPTTPPMVSIVMLCWNRLQDVQESLCRIGEIDYPNYEVILVDNASSDGTAAMVNAQFPHIRLIETEHNEGIAAYNRGFEAAKGEYIVILDDDSFPEKHALTRMVRHFQEQPDLGVVAFDVRNFYSYDQVRAVHEQPDTGKQTDYLMGFNGAGAGIRRALFRQVGFYPGEFFLYQNELDVALKVWDAGYRICSFADIVSYHKYSPTNRTSWRAPYFYTRNIFWVVWKNFPFFAALKRTLLLIFACFYHGMEQHTWVYLKAMVHAFTGVRVLAGKRKPVRAEVVRKFRIAYSYFFTFYR